MLINQQDLKGQSSHAAFQFVDHPSYTRLASLGGVNITAQSDPLMFLSNPALLDSSNLFHPALHYLNFPGGINAATLGYSFSGFSNGIIGVGIQYFNYGELQGFDDLGLPTGGFLANEFAISTSYARQTGIFNYGGSIKLMGSVLDSFQAYAIAFDFGVNYQHPAQDLTLAINLRNLGFNVKNYIDEQNLQLPTDVRIGASFKPEHAPFRFHLTLRNLQAREMDFYNPNIIDENQRNSIGASIFRRAVFGVEIIPSEYFNLQMGYNHLIRREFDTTIGAGSAGFTGGLAFKMKQFEFSYARMFYHVPGGSNVIGVSSIINNKKRSF